MRLTKNENGFYEVKVKDSNGKIRSFSTRKRNREDAKAVIKEAKIHELELAAEAGILSPSVVSVLLTGHKMTVESAIQHWKEWMEINHNSKETICAFETWIRAWSTAASLDHRPLMSITERDIDPWLNCPRLKTKASTRRLMLTSIRSYFKFCSAKGWTMGNPAALLKIDYSLMSHGQKEAEKKPIFEDQEVDDLLLMTSEDGDKPSSFWHAAIAIGRWTGLRLGDICCLEWDCLSTPGKIAVWTRKRDKRVELDIEPSKLKEAIDNLEDQDPVYVFPYERLTVLDPKTRPGLSVAFARLLHRAGIWGKSFHCLRATLATRLDQAGVNRDKIREVLGHSDVATTEGYIRPTEED